MNAPAVTRIQARRRLIVVILLAFAMVGAVMRLVTDPASLSHDIGTLLLVLWVPAVGNIIGYLMERYRRKPGSTLFDPAAPFIGERLATLRFTAPAPDLARPLPCTLLQGSEGFTARLRAAPPGAAGDKVELQFLKPALALPRFPPGAAFRVVVGRTVVGEGLVR